MFYAKQYFSLKYNIQSNVLQKYDELLNLSIYNKII